MIGRRQLLGGGFAIALAALVATILILQPGDVASPSTGSSIDASPVAASSASPSAGPTPDVPPSASPASPDATASPSPGPTAAPSTATPRPSPTPAPTPAPTASHAAGVPAFEHIYLIVMENHSYGSIVGKASYIDSLIAQYGLATQYTAVGSPSQPNYFALFSGATQKSTDNTVDLNGKNLADQLEAHGKTWSVFAENVPLGCFTGDSSDGGPDGNGTYVRRHEPAISFTSISGNPARCARITDFSHFSPSAADFELIIPNLCHDMHDCSVSQGDSFLKSFVPKITSSAAFANSVLFITWDEGSGSNHVATLVISPLVAAGTRSSVGHDHYSMLRTIENAWGLGCLQNSCSANDLGEFFGG